MYTVNNDFHQGQTIFEVLSDLEVPYLDRVPESPANGVKDHPNGTQENGSQTNGTQENGGHTNGTTVTA